MPRPDGSEWFVGDLSDPWVAAIAGALPAGFIRRSCAFDLPDDWLATSPGPTTLVLHRAILTPHDAGWVVRMRSARTPPPRVILCAGPHIRYADLERWAPLFDVVLPEATARETISRHLAEHDPVPRSIGPRPRLCVVSTNYELRSTLADACQSAGYPAMAVHEWSDAPPGVLTIWDVPVLEPGWKRELAARSRDRTMVALLGFADRATVSEARAAGASACLELPCDLADLVSILDRLTAARAEPGHEVPPPPAAFRRPPRPVAEARPEPYNS